MSASPTFGPEQFLAPPSTELYVLIMRGEDLWGPWAWDWYVTKRPVPTGRVPSILDSVASGHASWRWTARWGARRACRHHTDPLRGAEHWTYTREDEAP